MLLSLLSPYVDEITGERHCGFWCNKPTTDQIFCICHILEKKWEYNETVHQLFIDFKKAYDSVRKEVLYNIFIVWNTYEIRLIKMCLNETCTKVHRDKHLSDSIPFQNGLKQGYALSPLRFNFALECAIKKVQEN
jgi:hypothetical protein